VWAEVVAEPEVLFQGGPVETNGALAVALRRSDPPGPRGPGALDHPDAPGSTVGLREVTGRLALLDLDTPTELVATELAGLRIFAGYAGWGAGQLAGEVEEGSWYVVAGEAGDIFRPDTTSLWRDVLRRQPGDLAWHSTRPADPELN
jgi:putative transcriptional regulator